MLKKNGLIIIILALTTLLSSCISNVWTGAKLLYDRHDVYKKLNDYQLVAEVNHALYFDRVLKCEQCALDVALFNGDILIAGHLPSAQLIEELRHRLYAVRGYNHLFIQVKKRNEGSNSLADSWLTTKIRSQIFADDSIDPDMFKVITSDNVVYLMGEAKLDQAEKIISIARNTAGVSKVVTLLRYLTYQKNVA